MSTSMENWNAQRLPRYAEAVEKGLHDDQCEQRERSSLCHCGKRARIAAGRDELPDEDLYFPPPDCPSCDGDLEFDGDGFSCEPCALSWDSSGRGSSVQRTDEYGADDFGGPQFGERMVDLLRQKGAVRT